MNVLVVGSGGREHALVHTLKKNGGRALRCFAAPGNGGISQDAQCVPVSATDIASLVSFVKTKKIHVTVAGPEASLMAGIADTFKKNKLKIFGPEKEAARVEGSKSFAKKIMMKSGIKTAKYKMFDSMKKALAHAEKASYPVVIKADGLCAGKGVVLAKTKKQARDFIVDCMEKKIFGKEGERVLIEECLVGREFSFFVVSDGETVFPLGCARDYKRIFDGDRGPNTGGMGCYSPVPFVTREIFEHTLHHVMEKAIRTFAKMGHPYEGFLYGGMMLTKNGPYVLEFNARMGDPETQALLPRFTGNLLKLIEACVEHKLHKEKEKQGKSAGDAGEKCVGVVCASRGYPQSSETGQHIAGLDRVMQDDIFVFHAGTKKEGNAFVTNGGRVLNVVARADTFAKARKKVYSAVKRISFSGMQYRTDIAQDVA